MTANKLWILWDLSLTSGWCQSNGIFKLWKNGLRIWWQGFERIVICPCAIHAKLTVPTKRQYLSLVWDSLSFIRNLQRWRAATITATVHWYNAYWHAHAHVARAVLDHWHFRKRIEPYRNLKFINSDGREHDDVCFYRFEQINLWRINKYVCLCIVHGGKQHAPFRASDNFI